jgi:invasion protein IalB
MRIAQALTGAFASILLMTGAALAQAPAPPARPEIKPVGDWFVRCFPAQSPSPCDVFQELDNQNTRQRVLSLSLAFVPSMDRHIVQITVPLDVSIPKGVVIQTDSYTSPVLKYRMCNRDGCFVQMAVDNAMVEALSRSGPAGKVNIVADSGKTYPIGFSLKGFAAAHDSMVEQARAKAKPVAKAADGAASTPTP